MRKLALGLLLALSFLAPTTAAFGQACPAVAALPDSERRVSYAPVASAGPFSVTFAIYGDGTDYATWAEVWLNGVLLTPVTDWQLTIPSGTLATACRPITNASVTLSVASTGTLQIVGARRPRRTSQFSENRGVAARDLNQALTDIIAQNRETWDKINDVTGRGMFSQPGNTVGGLPLPALCASRFLGFDATGLIPQCLAGGAGSGNVVGPVVSVDNDFALFSGVTGAVIKDSGFSIVPLNKGGTNASLTASNGGIVWSTATAFAVLSGTATAGLPMLSGSTATPTWATVTYPASAISGGVACFTSTTAMASSGTLTANAVVTGGGLGVCPGVVTPANNALLKTSGAGTPSWFSAGVANTIPFWDGATIAWSGSPTLTSLNNIVFTAPVVAATLTLGSGKTITISNTLTFTGNDGSSVNFGAGGTAVFTTRTINTTAPITGGGDLSADRTIACATCGITTNPLSQFAATTSAQLAGVLSDETGTGVAVFGTSPSITTDIRPASDGGADLGTSALRWGTGFINAITASGQAARTWQMARHATADTPGNNLTINAGGATSGATNRAGGTLTLAPGVSTGSGVGSVQINVYPGTAAATTDNTAYAAALFASTAIVFRGPDNATAWQFNENVNGNARMFVNLVPTGAANGANGYFQLYDNNSGAKTGLSQIDGVVISNLTTDSTSSTTGSLQSKGGIAAVKAIWAGTYVAIGAVAVASLPTCGAGTEGARASVNNSNAASFTAGIGAVVAAGGTTHVPVYCDGTNWRIGANDNWPKPEAMAA